MKKFRYGFAVALILALTFAPSYARSAEPAGLNAEELFAEGTDAFMMLDFSKAFDCFMKAAAMGHGRAQFTLGVMYSEGRDKKFPPRLPGGGFVLRGGA